MKKSRLTVPPADILRLSPPSVRAGARLLRDVIRQAAPDLKEAGYPGWRCIAYRHPIAGYVCGIFPLETTVKLYFEQGVRLADPLGILEGAGRQTRYMTFAARADVAEKAALISMLVREAVGLKN